MQEKTPIDRDLQQLDADLRRLEADYTLFFSQRLPRPPWVLRRKVEALIRKWDRAHIPSTADRFRFTTLQTRFATYSELWERNMRNRDAGGIGAPAAAPDRNGNRPRVLYVATLSDPSGEPVALATLYHKLNKARLEHGDPPIGFTHFAELVREQVTGLRASGHTSAAFRVAIEDGRVTLTVKGVKNEGS